MYAAQLHAYKEVHKATMSGREIEAHALRNAALKLQSCRNLWGQEGHFERLDEALTLCQRIWTVLQSELARDDNPLPRKLKEDLLSLSVFIDKRIMDIMVDPAPQKLDIVISLNLNLAAGLRNSQQ